MADVASTLRQWSTTAASNSPSSSTTIGSGLAPNLQTLQAVVRQYLSSKGSNIASATTTDLSTMTGLYAQVTGNTTITGFGTENAGTWYILEFAGALTLTYNATSMILPGAANITTAAGDIAIAISEGSGNWRVLYFPVSGKTPLSLTPTRQKFGSGSGTYTTPTGCTRINVRMVGAGGGGGGASNAGGGTGGTGGSTTFSTFTASGGAGGTGGSSSSDGTGGAGGTTSGAPDIGVNGGNGWTPYGVGTPADGPGGGGGISAFGGAGAPVSAAGGASGKTNSGGGGAGGGSSSGSAFFPGGGGGAGGYVETAITAPSATYSYGVGAAGTAGTGSFTGGAGGSGLIIVDEFYT